MGPETALKVHDFSVRRGEDMIDLHFEIINSGDAKLYEFVKMYVGELYVGLEYMHLDPGETHVIEFQANARTVAPDDDVLLTTDSKEEGIIFDKTLDELLSIPDDVEEPTEHEDVVAGQPKEIREELEELKEKDIPEERWEELEAEFEDLQGEEKEEKKKILERLREEYKNITGETDDAGEPHGVEAAREEAADDTGEKPSVSEGGKATETGNAPPQTQEGRGDEQEETETAETPERPQEGLEEESADDYPSRPAEDLSETIGADEETGPAGSGERLADEKPERPAERPGTTPGTDEEDARPETSPTEDADEAAGPETTEQGQEADGSGSHERPAEQAQGAGQQDETGEGPKQPGAEATRGPQERPPEETGEGQRDQQTGTEHDEMQTEEGVDEPWKDRERPDEAGEGENVEGPTAQEPPDTGEESREDERPQPTGGEDDEQPQRSLQDREEAGKPEKMSPAEGPDDDTGTGEPAGPSSMEQIPEDEVERKVKEFEQQRDEEEPEGKNVVRSVVDSIFGSSHADEEETADIEEPEEGEPDEQTGQEGEDEESEGYDYQDEDELPPSLQVDRVTTGVDGLDEKMQGGLVQGTMNLVTGKTGTGKTAFCANFLKGGADDGQPGVYVTTEERQEDIRADIEAMFGWSFEEMEEEGLVKILSIKPIFPSKEIDNLNRLVRSYISNLLDEVMAAVDEIDADRVIIDSVSIIEMFIRDEYMARVALASLLNKLREANVTAVLTGTVPETSEGLSGGGIIEFLVDTVILLEFVPVAEEHKRTLTIRKMRRTDHRTEIFPFDITPDGIKIFDPQGGFMGT